ncbi:hypothetical protein [Mycolicibacterium sp.]|uniref:hypothetical protein n=1 Tax=Mycolicibacterium sp. TaxID=2320850 RepID=UPI003D1244B9
MVTELQFIAVGAFLLWGLASALCDVLLPDEPPGHDENAPRVVRARSHRPSAHSR